MINQSKEQYKYAYWFLQKKPIFKKIALYTVIFLIALLWINFFIVLIQYLANISKTKDIFTDLGKNYVNYRAIAAPQNLLITKEALLNSGNGKFDAFAVLTNPNNYWGADITYQFSIPGTSTTPKSMFILPQEKKFIADLGLEGLTSEKEATLQILDKQWKGVGARSKLPQADIVFEQEKYSIIEFPEESEENYSRVTAVAFNNDIYGYKDLKITVLLTSQNISQGVGVIYLNDFLSGEKRSIEFNWPRKFPFNSEFEFNVDTDVLNPDNLILE